MDIDVYSSPQLDIVFQVLRTALSANGGLEPHERPFLETYATITGYPLSSNDPQRNQPPCIQVTESPAVMPFFVPIASTMLLPLAKATSGHRKIRSLPVLVPSETPFSLSSTESAFE